MKILFFAISFFITGYAFTQTPINAQLLEINFLGESKPQNIFTFQNIIYFTADDGVHGRELWKVENGNPIMVMDINEGVDGTFDENSLFLATNNFMYFTTSNRNKLWKTDGTVDGTHVIINNPYSPNPAILDLIEYNSNIFFNYNDLTNGYELWKTDGSTSGTSLVKDINIGNGSSEITDFFIFNNQLYFTAIDGVHGREIWKTDGIESGTTILKDIYPSSVDGVAYGNNFLILNNYFYFYGNSQQYGYELWKSDGTGSGTAMVKDINPGVLGSDYWYNKLTGAAGEDFLVFRAFTPTTGYELWKTDGTEQGTQLLKEFYTENGEFGDGIPSGDHFYSYNGKVYFNAFQENYKLWITDGTLEGTSKFIDLDNNQDESYDNYKTYNDNLYFSNSARVIKTDGQTSDVFVNMSSSGGISQYQPIQDKVYFVKNFDEFYGLEIWESRVNTQNLKVLEINSGHSSSPRNFASFGDKVVFFGHNYTYYEVPMISDGTPEGTKSILDSPPFRVDNNYAAQLFHAGNNMFFMATNNQNNWELYKTDGTPEGTGLVKDLTGDGGQGLVRELYANYNNVLYFVGNDDLTGSELYRSDGTEEGTYKVKDLGSSNYNGTYIYSFDISQNYLYFSGGIGNSEVITPTVWRTDGTAEGTQEVIQFQQGVWADRALILKSIGDRIFIYKNNYPESYDLYVSNGTQESLQLLKTFSGGSEGGIEITLPTQYQNELYFVQNDKHLYVSDGTNEGTVEIEGLENLQGINQMFVCGDYLYFVEGSYSLGNLALWRTNGSSEGTMKLAENGEEFHEIISNVTCFNSHVLFSNGNHWSNFLNITDGEFNNLYMAEIIVNDGYEFGEYEGISKLFSHQNKLYIEISTNKHGDELYVASPEFLLNSEEIESGLTNNKSKILIYPNPTSAEINVVSNDESKIQQIQLYDLTGKLMELGMYNSNEVKLNLSKYNAGIYLIKVKTEKNTETKKVIVK